MLSEYNKRALRLINRVRGGLNLSFFPLFSLLHQWGAVTEVAEKLGVSHPGISKIAHKMQQEGLSKIADPDDERRQLLALLSQSEPLLEQIASIWHAIERHRDGLIEAQQHSLLDSFIECERLLTTPGFYTRVLQQLKRRHNGKKVLQGWDDQYRENFKRLHLVWLTRYFAGELIERDRQALDNPEGYYLARHPMDNQIVGCVALARHSDTQFEIAKVGVDYVWQIVSVGRRLLMAVLEKSRELGAAKVSLETSGKLERAFQLYQNLGFRQVFYLAGAYYHRADLYMRLSL